MKGKKALLGFHNSDDFGIFGLRYGREGYSIEMVTNVDKMIELAGNDEYAVYLMDANLGSPGSQNVSSSKRVYDLVKERVDRGDAEFHAVAGLPTTVREAKNEGIPAMTKSELIYKLDS